MTGSMPSQPRIPGFTADAAVETTAHVYLADAARRDGPAVRRVTPQAMRFGTLAGPGSGRGTCRPDCLCVTQEGCPCCPPASGSGPRVLPGLPITRRW
jgi:hypothetical protein